MNTNLHVEYISSIELPGLDIFSKMSEPQLAHYFEPDGGLFVAETPEVIVRAVAAGYEPYAVLAEERYLDSFDFSFMEAYPDARIYVAPVEKLIAITGYNLTRGLLAAFKRKPYEEISDFVKGKNKLVVLEGVVNPTNIGAIFRSAAAMFADGIILTKDCADPLYRRASRVSVGNVFQVPWTYYPGEIAKWYKDGVGSLKEQGFVTVATALDAESIPITDERLKHCNRLAVLMGSEGFGLKKATIAQCDYKAIIPMSHHVDSLNVAAASAVVFWELFGK